MLRVSKCSSEEIVFDFFSDGQYVWVTGRVVAKFHAPS